MSNFQTSGESRLARYMAAAVAKAAVPPPAVLDRAITPADIRDFPEYFIWGPGQNRAVATLCDHGYTLVDSCPGCDNDD